MGQGLDDLAIRGAVADGGVAGQGLGIVDRAGVGAADHRSLDAAVLVAERDLQVEDVFAVALEAEVARLDDAGVYRPDCHFVNGFALDPVKVHHADERLLSWRPAPGIVAGTVGSVEADRLEPRMAAR